jgi:methylglutaconyl-CoA hydratase
MNAGDRLVVRRDGDLLRLTLNDPERANALSPPLIEDLTAAYRRDWLGEGVRAIVLDAAGRNFSAGADLDHLRSLRDAGPEQNLADSRRLRDLFAAVLRQEAYTVALVHGACVAGGCGLATAHDCVVAAEDARFMYSEVRIGFVAALVATFLQLRVRGRDARELLLDPEFVGAPRALEIGLVNRIAARQHLEAEGLRCAAAVLEKASSQSIALSKRLMLDIVGLPLAEAMDRAAEVNAAARSTPDCRRGIDTFLETKKTPNWR